MKLTTHSAFFDNLLEDLVVSRGQVRVKDVGKEIEDLAESIRVMGLLEPIVVCESDKSGKYEILTGQRRFLAHRTLKRKSIKAAVLKHRVDESTAKAISVTENLIRRDLSQRELVDACTSLYKKYGTIKAVVESTGITARKVSQFVKYDRLITPLKKMVDSGEVDVNVALRAQDAAAAGGEQANSTEAVKFAKEMVSMSGPQRRKLTQERKDNPDASADELIEDAKTGAKVTQVVVTLSAAVHHSLRMYAEQEGMNQDDAAGTLIEEALQTKGFSD
jgi:ParB family transcriptional regulator, chromosome partitioning protein